MALCRLRVEDCDGWEHTVLGLEWFEELTRLPFNVSHQKPRKGVEFHFIRQHAQHGTCWWILVLIDLLLSYIGPAQSDVCSGKAMTSITLITEDLGHVLCRITYITSVMAMPIRCCCCYLIETELREEEGLRNIANGTR